MSVELFPRTDEAIFRRALRQAAALPATFSDEDRAHAVEMYRRQLNDAIEQTEQPDTPTGASK